MVDVQDKKERVWSLSSDFLGFRVKKWDYQSYSEECTHDIHIVKAFTNLVMHSSGGGGC